MDIKQLRRRVRRAIRQTDAPVKKAPEPSEPADPSKFPPAIRVGNRVYTGPPTPGGHVPARNKAWRDGAIDNPFQFKDVEEGFVVPGEGFISRRQAQERFGFTNTENQAITSIQRNETARSLAALRRLAQRLDPGRHGGGLFGAALPIGIGGGLLANESVEERAPGLFFR